MVLIGLKSFFPISNEVKLKAMLFLPNTELLYQYIQVYEKKKTKDFTIHHKTLVCLFVFILF